MKLTPARLLNLLVLLTLLCPAAQPAPANAVKNSPRVAPTSVQDYGQLPLYFVANGGQADPQVDFYVQGSDKTLYFTSEGVTFALTAPLTPTSGLTTTAARLGLKSQGESESPRAAQRWAVKLDFVGANPNVHPVGQAKATATISYFKGRPEEWHAGLPTYTQIVYPDLWPGIDLVFSGDINQLKYEFQVQPGADPSQIQLAYEGASGVRLTDDGQLEVSTPLGSFRDAAPVAYQTVAGQRVPVEMNYHLVQTPQAAPDSAPSYLCTFTLGTYDVSLPLVLDPAFLVYAGFIGGADMDVGCTIAVDSAGNAYITGFTTSDETTFPMMGGPDLTYNGAPGGGYGDAFVVKVNASGTGLVYAGYIGGANSDAGFGIAVDGAGNAYVTGHTFSDEATFPVTVGPDLSFNSIGINGDAFVAKVSAAGTEFVYAGYIGGASDDAGLGIAVDNAGNAYVTGDTGSDEATFPVTVGPDLTYNGGGDAFVAKVNAAGTAFVYVGYLGGTSGEEGRGIGVDSEGNAYIAGSTSSDENTFPVAVGPDLTYHGGGAFGGDAFVAKVNAAGIALVYAGYIGGAGDDSAHSIAVDSVGNAYVAGGTASDETTFPVTVGPDLTYNGGTYGDAFVAKVKAAGTALVYAGYIGGAGTDTGYGIAVDGTGNAYVAGDTDSDETTFPVLEGPDLTYNGGIDAYVAKVNAAGTAFIYAGYIGGASGDIGNGIAVDGAGNAYVTGETGSDETTFPVVVGPSLTHHGSADVFVAKVSVGFTVAGRITGPGTNPVAGVLVSIAPGSSATTDAGGYYTITNVLSGTYTLTPALSGYTFSPITRTVSVPPDATAQDFTGAWLLYLPVVGR